MKFSRDPDSSDDQLGLGIPLQTWHPHEVTKASGSSETSQDDRVNLHEILDQESSPDFWCHHIVQPHNASCVKL